MLTMIKPGLAVNTVFRRQKANNGEKGETGTKKNSVTIMTMLNGLSMIGIYRKTGIEEFLEGLQ